MDRSSLGLGKKNARRRKAWLIFEDESGFSQRPAIRATWALKGKTPVVKETLAWQNLTGLGAIRCSADGKHPKWFLSLKRGSARSADILRFLKALKRHNHKPIILVWDNLPAHRSRPVRDYIKQNHAWLTVERLPPYSPELNPVEPFWDWLDDTVSANTPMENLKILDRRLRHGLQRIQKRPGVGRGFLKHTGLF
jgi:transposase